MLQIIDLLFGRVIAEPVPHRIAGNDVNQQKNKCDYSPYYRRYEQQALRQSGDEVSHAANDNREWQVNHCPQLFTQISQIVTPEAEPSKYFNPSLNALITLRNRL